MKRKIISALLIAVLCLSHTSLNAQAQGVRLSKTKATLVLSQSVFLKLKSSKNKTLTKGVRWSSSNIALATVSKKGRVKAKKTGKVKIYAVYKGKRYRCEITVKNAVAVSAKSLTFKSTQTRKTLTVSLRGSGTVSCDIISGSELVSCAFAKKWSGDKISLYVKRTSALASGTAVIRISSDKRPKNSVKVKIKLISPCTLTVKNKLPCTVTNTEPKTVYNDGAVVSSLKINKVTSSVNADGIMNITVSLEVLEVKNGEARQCELYYRIMRNGYVIASDSAVSQTLAKGDKAKVKIRLYDLEKGEYTIEFTDHTFE
jgi:hypothetical protein